MMMKKKCGVHKAVRILLMVGGLNWLLVGVLGKDFFGLIGMGTDSTTARFVYVLIGFSALAKFCLKCCKGKCMCGSGKQVEDCCMNNHEAHKDMTKGSEAPKQQA